MIEGEIKVGDVFRFCEPPHDVAFTRIKALDGRDFVVEDGPTERGPWVPAGARWTEGNLRREHTRIAAPAPAASQHPADLKPRGVKAPLYLIPWDAVAGTDLHPLDIALREAIELAQSRQDPLGILDVLSCRVTLEQVAEVFAYGARKYARDNWRTFAWDDSARDEYFGAICRHVLADARGEKIDPESGQPHLAHAACGCLIWRWHELRLERARTAPVIDGETVEPMPYTPRKGDRVMIPGIDMGTITRDGWGRVPAEATGAGGTFYADADSGNRSSVGEWSGGWDIRREARPDV